MKDIKETCIDHVEGEGFITFCSSERKWINRIERYAREWPNDVVVKSRNTDGSIVASMPYSWFKPPSPPRRISPEAAAAAAERLANARMLKHMKAQ